MEIFCRAVELKNTQEEIAHSIKRVIVRVGGALLWYSCIKHLVSIHGHDAAFTYGS